MLRLISYLAPSIPAAFFEVVARAIRQSAGIDVRLRFEERISGPLPGDPNPFADGTADIGFVCSPTYRWLREDLELLPLPVPTDHRAGGSAVYFADVVVHAGAACTTFEDLRGARWAYNDRNSRSGWFSMLERIAPETPHELFAELRQARSHLESLRLVQAGHADAAAIDSNALRHRASQASDLGLRVLETWGPFPIQPIVIHKAVPAGIKEAVRQAMLGAHSVFAAELSALGFARFIEVDSSVYDT